MGALDTAVRSGRALYAGISSYGPARTAEAARILRELGTPLLIHQPSYSMLNRWVEDDGLFDVLETEGVGCIGFTRARAGPAHRQVPRRRAGGLADGDVRLDGPGRAHRGQRRPAARAGRRREEPRAVAGADGAGVGAARPADDLAGDRGEQRRAAGGERRRARQPGLHRRASWPRSTGSPSRAASTSGGPRARRSSRGQDGASASSRSASQRPLDGVLGEQQRLARTPPAPPRAGRAAAGSRPGPPAGSRTPRGPARRRARRARRGRPAGPAASPTATARLSATTGDGQRASSRA